MKKRLQQAISLLLTLCTLLSLLPTAALAADAHALTAPVVMTDEAEVTEPLTAPVDIHQEVPADPEPQETPAEEAAGTEATPEVLTATFQAFNPLYPEIVLEVSAPEALPGDALAGETEYGTYEDAALQLRTGMEQRTTEIVTSFTSEEEISGDLIDLVFDDALAETGVSTQGDYLRWHWGGYECSCSYYLSEEDGLYYNTVTWTLAYYTTAAQETELTKEVEKVISGFSFTDSTTDYEKVCTIYEYICSNVTYDHEGLEAGTSNLIYTAYAALINGTSVCQGYANLLYRMLLEVDIPARIISGTSSGEGHAWNIVKLGNHWYNLDSTWDASSGEAQDDYLLKCTANFPDHTRDTEYNTDAFHAAYPMASSDYAPVTEVARGTCGENITWVLDSDGTLALSGTGVMTSYTLGNTPWYSYRTSIKSVVVGSGITSLSSGAFYGCTALRTASLPDGLISIAGFNGCTSLASINIPNSVTTIGANAFSGCTALTGIAIPDSVTLIGQNAFSGCSSMKTVTLGSGLKTIGYRAFYNCKALTEITVPESVTEFGNNAFEFCVSMTSAVLNNTGSIGDYAFLYCNSLESVTIGDKATSTGSCCFQYCSSLTDVTLGKNITLVGPYSFAGCSKLTEITIPDSVETLGGHCFYNCQSLVDVDFGTGLTAINEYAFCACVKLSPVSIPNSVTTLGDSAFSDCDALTKITVPAGVTTVGSGVFSGCDGLTSATILGSIIGSSMFKDCSSLCEVSVKNITSMGSAAFYDCDALSEIDLPEGLTALEASTFGSCDGLTTLTIPDSVTTIGEEACCACAKLETLIIGAGVTSVEQNAFSSCPSLTSIYFRGDRPKFVNCCKDVTATAYYPADNTTWENWSSNLGGTLTWLSYSNVHLHEWDAGTVLSTPTCTTQGSTRYTCTSCGETKTETTPALEHDYVTTVVHATCTTDGYTSHLCSRCGHSYTDAYVTASGHVWNDGVVTKAATETEPGEMSYPCLFCEAVRTEEIPVLLSGLNLVDGVWGYYKNGQVATDVTTLVLYYDSWWYVKDGLVDFSYAGLVYFSGSWWYVTSGRVDFSYTGLCYYNGGWWYVKSGRVDFSYTGLCYYNGGWWYVKSGKVDFSYTGLCYYNSS